MSIFFHRKGIESFCRLFSTQQHLYQTPGLRPPRTAGRFVNTVTRGWVAAPNERAPFRFHGTVVGFVDHVCPGLGISPLRTKIWLSFSQTDLGPRSARELFGEGVLNSLKLFFQAEDGIRDVERSRGLGDVYKRQLSG